MQVQECAAAAEGKPTQHRLGATASLLVGAKFALLTPRSTGRGLLARSHWSNGGHVDFLSRWLQFIVSYGMTFMSGT
jgi:hypothetical protein